ncbi:hypothetical protein C7B65_00800 [Phormidesmis priestleyi ULC007]|uniref:Uncharacterized protein n=1 Tax=Phormidesmis priestleyi ULC007 TaxID=1920490 RepID=A0A2T1DNA5_9CYAN|nr:hypothetical protein [Phormidesmis priestleyi]PSB21987.1 hypothetical protein C7B65_00800 [Phormidesmis priestleyi ULC007]PZO55045.1 MAG: hypothetical protein DCF14_00775 [Phormidesmis priestleyi]
MNNKDEFNRFLPDESLDPDKLSIGIPAEQTPLNPDRIPSGFDPMGEIQLRGRAYRSLAGGQAPWWVLISGWVIFGGFVWIMVRLTVLSSSFVLLIPLAIATIPLFILLKGTKAKLASQRHRRRR